ncbi:MAG: BA14K family protein [Alphaproteobacteria bacterium]|nr:BA14K family protein [Alphaproteobacteria bacterium]
MAAIQSGGTVRKFVTRVLATSALLGVYMFGTAAATGMFMSAGITAAQAQRGRRGRGRGRGRGNVGAAIGAGVAIGIIGGAIAADAARRRSDAVEYCMSRYRSYNPETGTWIDRQGNVRYCP